MLPSFIRTGNGDLDGLLALLEDGDEVVVDPERVGDGAQPVARDRERILAEVALGWRCDSAHDGSSFPPATNDIAISTVIGAGSGSSYGAVSVGVVDAGGGDGS